MRAAGAVTSKGRSSTAMLPQMAAAAAAPGAATAAVQAPLTHPPTLAFPSRGVWPPGSLLSMGVGETSCSARSTVAYPAGVGNQHSRGGTSVRTMQAHRPIRPHAKAGHLLTAAQRNQWCQPQPAMQAAGRCFEAGSPPETASRDWPGLTVPLSTTYGVAACFWACISGNSNGVG